MRKNRLLILVGIMIAVFAIAAVACDDDDDDDDDVSPTATVADDGDGNGAVTTLSALITGVDDAGITGSATLTEENGVASIALTVLGLPPGPHANHVHHGTCAEQGEIHVTLQELEADDNGDAAGMTSAEPPAVDPSFPLSHFEQGHYVAIHADDFAVIACGDVV